MLYTNIIGRLGADAELRTSAKGNQFLSMRVASNDFIGGENVTTWVNVMWSGERAVKMQEHMKKGSAISAHGKLRTSIFTNKNGEQNVSIDLFADSVDFVSLGKSGETQSNDATTETGTFKPSPKKEEVAVATAASKDAADDLPF
jgi:single-strand DNA-binding protein